MVDPDYAQQNSQHRKRDQGQEVRTVVSKEYAKGQNADSADYRLAYE